MLECQEIVTYINGTGTQNNSNKSVTLCLEVLSHNTKSGREHLIIQQYAQVTKGGKNV